MTRRKPMAKRQPNGDIVRKKSEDRAVPLHRVRQMIFNGALDPLYATPLGHLALQKKIDQEQFNAGVRYRADRRQVDMILGLPARDVRALDYSKTIMGGGPGADPTEAQLKAVKLFREAETFLRHDEAEYRIVNNVVIGDAMPVFAETLELIAGLERLAMHYGYRRSRSVKQR